MRKNHVSLFVVGCLCATLLTGCGGDQSAEQSGTPATPTATPTDSANEIYPVSRGFVTDGATYACGSGDLFLTPAQDWQWLGDESICQIFEIDEKDLAASGEPFSPDVPVAYDVMAQDPTTGCSVTVFYDNLALQEEGTAQTPESYLSKIETSMGEDFAGTVEMMDEYTFADHTYAALKITAADGSLTQYCFARTMDLYSSYMLNVTVVVADGSSLEDILHFFSMEHLATVRTE